MHADVDSAHVERIAIVGSNFLRMIDLVQQFLGAAPHINAMKRSACIEGARMALARVKIYWAEMEATAIASPDSDGSRVPAEHYFQEVLQGARLIET